MRPVVVLMLFLVMVDHHLRRIQVCFTWLVIKMFFICISMYPSMLANFTLFSLIRNSLIFAFLIKFSVFLMTLKLNNQSSLLPYLKTNITMQSFHRYTSLLESFFYMLSLRSHLRTQRFVFLLNSMQSLSHSPHMT